MAIDGKDRRGWRGWGNGGWTVCAGNVVQGTCGNKVKKKGGRDSKWIGDTGWQRMRIDGSNYQDLDIDFSQPFCGEGEKRVEEVEGG